MKATPATSGPVGRARPSVWSRPERGRRGPAPAHTRDAIVSTAIALADADGLAAVSMRAVAAALGTGAGSLYRYVSSRDDVLDLMTDAVVAELRPYPDEDDDWLDVMVRIGQSQLALHRRHPWLVDLTPRSTGIGPETLAWFDACLRILEPVRAPSARKLEALALMIGVVTLIARSEGTSHANPFSEVDLASHPHLAAALSHPSATAPEPDLFERSMRILLAGLLASDPFNGNATLSETSIEWTQ